MTDDSHLAGFDPYDQLDIEAARIDTYLTGLDEAGWQRPSRCSEWTVRDLAAHLAAVEEYHHACLDDRVGELFQKFVDEGLTDLHDWNARGVRERADRNALDVVAEWREADADTRRRLRERDGGEMATSIGPYPVRWQAFHIASELATHADDLWVPVDSDERDARLAWRVPFSRFSLSESEPDVEAETVEGGTRVRADGHEAVLDDLVFVEAVAGRLPGDTTVDPVIVQALSTAP